MEYAAVRHFADRRYCYALEKGRFLIRLETKKGDAARLPIMEITIFTTSQSLI